jgi:hypothetical protein
VAQSEVAASVTTWKARRVGDRILCGRPAPDGGCRGLIATVYHYRVPGILGEWRLAYLPFGLKEDPPGSSVWVLKERSRTKGIREGRRGPTFLNGKIERGRKLARAGDGRQAYPPFWRACPVCNVRAEVTADLLE